VKLNLLSLKSLPNPRFERDSRFPLAPQADRCAGLARRSLGHPGPLVDTGVVNDNLAAPAPAQRSGGLPAVVGRRVPRRPTAPAADTPALRSGASPRRPRRGAAEPPLRWALH
jgi:hypothetical protein